MKIYFRYKFFPSSRPVPPPSLTSRASRAAPPGVLRAMGLHERSMSVIAPSAERWNEKESAFGLNGQAPQALNPVIKSARYVYQRTDLANINSEGVKRAAKHIYTSLVNEEYSPYTWHSHPLHLLPPKQYSPTDSRTKACLDWIFLISSLNFSFWSPVEGTNRESDRFGVEWREGWGLTRKKTWTGYWSLVAAINKALECKIPITDPFFYASSTLCPDVVIEDIFRPVSSSTESVPLLLERISVMREVGAILSSKFGGSYAGLLSQFIAKYSGNGTALQLVQMIVEEFPPFRDEALLDGRKVCFWKRAQILVAETWAAFYPSNANDTHPFFPHGIGQLTMFADYRVPQILHHLQIITYPVSLITLLKSRATLPLGSRPELSIRAASILAVEALRDEILRLCTTKNHEVKVSGLSCYDKFSSVVIDFYLWDLAKKVERGEEKIDGIQTNEMVPAHRTRSIWY